MGGWKTEFTLGYSLPLADFLFRAKDGRRVLNITFGCPLRDVVVEDLTVKVKLHFCSSSRAPRISLFGYTCRSLFKCCSYMGCL